MRALQEWPAERLLALARDTALAGATRDLSRMLELAEAPAGELQAGLAREARQREELAEAVASIGLSPDCPLTRLPALAEAIADAGEAEARLRDTGLPPGVDLAPTLHLAGKVAASGLPQALLQTLLSPSYPGARAGLHQAALGVRAKVEIAEEHLSTLGERFRADWSAVLGTADVRDTPLTSVESAARAAAARPDLLNLGAKLGRVRRSVARVGLGEAADLLARRATPPAAIPDVVELARVRGLLRAAFRATPALAELDGLQLGKARARFAEIDRELMGMKARMVAARLAARRMPAGIGIGPRSGYTEAALVNNELAKQRRFVSVRDLLGRAGAAVRALKPCFLMSPLSVAQFLKPTAPAFDLLVVDEASQMLPEDALGALLRAEQVVVVGDPRQLPPTDFFDRYDPLADGDDPLADEQFDAELILDLCRQTTFRPVRRLRWHYRSRHESLIAFAKRSTTPTSR